MNLQSYRKHKSYQKQPTNNTNENTPDLTFLLPSMVNTNKFHLLQLTPETINSSTLSINNDQTPEQPTTPLIPQQQQPEAYQIIRLHKRSFIDTGCLNNATTTEKENIALSMLQQLGKYDPSDKYVKTYRNRNIIKLYKKYTEEKLTKTNVLLRIYQYKQDINIRVDKNKNNK